MRADKNELECNARLLSRYLEQRLTAQEEAELEAHLDGCPACRQQMSDSAADPDWWTGASRYLKADAWDAERAAAPRAASARRTDRQSDEFVLRQLKEWLDPADDPRFIGRFGGYEILGIIGQGGMGVVLKGFEPSLNRYVAVKMLAPTLAASGAARQRFAREAQAAAAVLHENVIAIHRVAAAHDLPYLVMSYVGGMSLQQRIDDEGPLPLPAILRIGRQIASGLAAAHAQGLVHRDIKPANILLERGVERVAITDFGLARAADDGSVTNTGFIAGTPQYMSPEQARGDSIDARSDLFSLGSVLYAMCTGRPPFRAETSYGVLHRITNSQPRPIREINPDVPDWLEAIVRRLHAKSPSERLTSAEELAELLEQCVAHVQQPTAAPLPASLVLPAARSSRIVTSHRTGVVTMLATFGVALIAMLLWQGPDSSDGLNEATGDQTGVAAPAVKPSPTTYEVDEAVLDQAQLASDPPNSDEATALATELQPFQGTWKFGACESEFLVAPLDRVRTWRWTIEENQITWTFPGAQEWKLSFSIDAAQSPKRIDLKFLTGPHRGETSLGIFEFKRGGLWICLSDPGKNVGRPTDFSITGDGGRTLILLDHQPEMPAAAIRALEGTWKFRVCQSEWWPVWTPSGKEAVRNWRWIVAENKMSWTGPGFDGTKASFTLDVTKTPQQIDITIHDGPHRGTKSLGIYEFRRGSLLICLSDPGTNAARPADFSFETSGNRSLIILDRVDEN